MRSLHEHSLTADSPNKFKAAQYLRLAEQKGSKTVGNSW